MPQSIADELKSIPMSPSLGESLERAHRFAREQSHRAVTLEHLLLALTEDSEANIIMQSANVDLVKLAADVSSYLGRLDDLRAQGAVEPRPDAELLRVLQAAATAAQQSRRHQIDGAIVLAAMVGDGKSPAAGLLKALGMTFEEAIRALQRANTQARLKTVTKPVAAMPAAEAAAAAIAAAEAPGAAAPAAEDGDLRATTAQTAEDILAAARLRIQQRAAAARGEAVRPPEKPAAPVIEPAPPSAAPAAPPPAEAAPPAPHAAPHAAVPPAAEPPPQTRSPRPAWTPEPELPPAPTPTMRPPQSLAGRLPPGFPGAPINPEDGPARPPLPQAHAPQPQPQRHPLVVAAARAAAARPAQVPWPDPAERRPPARPGMPNGSFTGMPFPGGEAAPPHAAPSPRGAPAQRPAGHSERGPLVENVPRRMRVGVSAAAEVRIARERIDGLILALNGRGSAHRPDVFLARALTVRLRAPGGGFFIEAATPETQWVETGASLMHDDFAIWRWTLTPQRRGRGRLTLLVSARTVGHDGLAAETAPPDRAIEVKVGSNLSKTAVRWSAWLLAALVGVAAGRYAAQIWDAGAFAVKAAIGG
jgi:hypothetical protein